MLQLYVLAGLKTETSIRIQEETAIISVDAVEQVLGFVDIVIKV